MSKKILTKDILINNDNSNKTSNYNSIGLLFGMFFIAMYVCVIGEKIIEIFKSKTFEVQMIIELCPTLLFLIIPIFMIYIIMNKNKKEEKKINAIINGDFKIIEDKIIKAYTYTERERRSNGEYRIVERYAFKFKNNGDFRVDFNTYKNITIGEHAYLIIRNNSNKIDQMYPIKEYNLDRNLKSYLISYTEHNETEQEEPSSKYKQNTVINGYEQRDDKFNAKQFEESENELTYEEEKTLQEVFKTIDNAGTRKRLTMLEIKANTGDYSLGFWPLIFSILIFDSIGIYTIHKETQYSPLSYESIAGGIILVLIPLILNILFMGKVLRSLKEDNLVLKGEFSLVKDVVLEKKSFIKGAITRRYISGKTVGGHERRYELYLKNYGRVKTDDYSYIDAQKGDAAYVLILNDKRTPKHAFLEKACDIDKNLKPHIITYEQAINNNNF